MRSLAKYTSYPKNIPNVIPFKLLKFKSSKWKKIKKIIKNKIKIFKKRKQSSFFLKKRNRLLLLKKTRFFFFYGFRIQKRTMPNFNKYYKNCLITNRIIRQLFSNRSLKFEISSKNYNICFANYFIKQFFKPEVLLSKLSFFNSSEEALQNLSNGSVLINFEKKKSNYILKSGDIITLSNKKINFFLFQKIIEKNYFFKRKFFSFLEVDYITGTIIILKDFSTLNSFDFNLFFTFFINIEQFKNYNQI
jgi:hypothetical protein